MMTRMDIFCEDIEGFTDPTPYATLLFHNAGKAEDVRRELLADPALQGIDSINLETVLTDDDAVVDFYVNLNREV